MKALTAVDVDAQVVVVQSSVIGVVVRVVVELVYTEIYDQPERLTSLTVRP